MAPCQCKYDYFTSAEMGLYGSNKNYKTYVIQGTYPKKKFKKPKMHPRHQKGNKYRR